MRSMWNGSISFGLVTIPVALFPGTSREELAFKQLRKTDLSPINYKRIAQADGQEVQWADIVKGYEYEKGKFVILKEEDFKRVDLEAAAQTIDIMDFVELKEINPMFFYKPYFLEPGKGGEKAYALLRESLRNSGKIGIAKVVIRTREHLAGVKAQGDALILEIMHFGEELVNADALSFPKADQAKPREIDMAKKLIDGMTTSWNPTKYEDKYKTQLMAMIEEKIQHPDAKHAVKDKNKKPANVIDLVAVLQESLSATKGAKKSSNAKAATLKQKQRKAA
jgi:DNA end-binding protein Ku